jgi:hypothetical protein
LRSDPNTLYFAAGIAGERKGLFGAIRPVGIATVPEPSTVALLSTGVPAMLVVLRRRRLSSGHPS